MIIENVKPNLADAVPNKEERKAELPGKKKSRERKLKKRGRKFKKRAEKAEAANKKATRDAKRACHAQRKAERERDAAVTGECSVEEALGEKGQGRHRRSAWQRRIYLLKRKG